MGTYLVIKNNLKRSFYNRILFILLLVLPVLLTVLIGFVNQISSNSLRVGILTEENLVSTENMTDILHPSENIQYKQANVNSIHTDLIMKKFDFILDFRYAKEEKDYEVITYYGVEEETQKEVGITPTERMTAFLLTLLMITSTLNASGLIRDRKDGTLTRYRYSPQGVASYLSGYVFYTMIMAALQIAFSLLILRLLQIPFHLSLGSTIIIGTLIVGISSAFGTFISVTCKSDMKANITASSIAMFCSAIGGNFVPYVQMPNIMKSISVFSPVRWILTITQSMEQGIQMGNHPVPYIISVGFIVLLCISALASIRFKKY